MPSTELKPDESQFDAMNAAAAADPEAEARRTEMGQWAQAQGELAQGAARLHEQREAQLGEASKDFHPALRRTNEVIADQGVPVTRKAGEFTVDSVVKAVPGGVKASYEDGSELYRSPATIARDNKRTEKAA